eukprot:211858_1
MFAQVGQTVCTLAYFCVLLYTFLIDGQQIRSDGASAISLWFDWPYFALFASLLMLLLLSIIWRSNMFNHVLSLLVLQIPLYGIHQFEEYGYDIYGRSYHFIHYV